MENTLTFISVSNGLIRLLKNTENVNTIINTPNNYYVSGNLVYYKSDNSKVKTVTTNNITYNQWKNKLQNFSKIYNTSIPFYVKKLLDPNTFLHYSEDTIKTEKFLEEITYHFNRIDTNVLNQTYNISTDDIKLTKNLLSLFNVCNQHGTLQII